MPRCSGSGQDKDAGPNDAANTQENELPAMQFSPKMTLSITRLTELIHRLCSENVHNAFPAGVIIRIGSGCYSVSIICYIASRHSGLRLERKDKSQMTNDRYGFRIVG